MPRVGHAFERVRAAFLERQSGAGHEVADRLRDQHLARARKTGDARADVHGDSGNVVPYELAFAGVQAAAHLKAERAYRIADRAGTANRARRPVEGGEEAVARGVDLTPAVLLQHRASLGVERLEQFTPGMVAERRGALGR